MFENVESQDSQQVEQTESQADSQIEQAQKSEQPSILDLDSDQYREAKIKFEGQEFDRNSLRSAYMRVSDYTKKTQALAEERKYYDNLSADLKAVRENPALIEQFKKVYPEKFHNYLDYVKTVQQQATNKAEQTASPQSDLVSKYEQKIQELESKLGQIEGRFHKSDVEKIEAELDATFDKMKRDFPHARNEIVINQAQAKLANGEEITQDTWRKLFKASHEESLAFAKEIYSKQFKEQAKLNEQGKDVPSGGGLPGKQPAQPRSIREATEWALREMQG